MKRAILLIGMLLASLIGSASAQTQGSIKLQCDVKYSNWTVKPPVVDLVMTGIYVEILSKTVEIVGTSAFDTTYEVTRRNETSIFWELHDGQGYQGNINRFSGQLNLLQFDAGGKIIKQLAKGHCRRAQPLF